MKSDPTSEPSATAKPARVFFALWPDAAVARRLHELGAEAHAECGGRRTRCDTLHLTLAFIGDVSPQRLDDLIAVGDRTGATAFTLRLDRLGGWRHNRIVWAGAQICPPPLTELVERLNAALDDAGFVVERRPFAVHVTLLRKTHVQLPPRSVAPIDWRVGGFALVESLQTDEGARYRLVREWRAGNGDGCDEGCPG